MVTNWPRSPFLIGAKSFNTFVYIILAVIDLISYY
jgi:hypothetical protein